MPTQPEYRGVENSRGRGTVVSWAGLKNGEAGAPAVVARHRDRSVQVTGTFGTGGNVRIEGSNDGGQNWAALHDPSGTVLNITSGAEIPAVLEATEMIRPRITAGDGSTSVSVHLFVGGDK